jgi:hypothetical protein
MRTGAGQLALVWAAALAAGSGAWGQVVLTPVEQGVADVDMLSSSLRSLQADLRAPAGFERVYEGSWEDRYGQRSGFFARVSGGVTAVFPMSRYSAVLGGIEPEIPAGTVFYLGDPPEPWPQSRGPQTGGPGTEPAPNRLDYSVAGGGAAPIGAWEEVVVERTVWTDSRYRQRRVEGLLLRAAAVERGG